MKKLFTIIALTVLFSMNAQTFWFQGTGSNAIRTINATASGVDSTAMGITTTASGDYSTAMGESTTASGDRSTAIGASTEASGDRSTAMGESTTASGSRSTAMGNVTTASGSLLQQWEMSQQQVEMLLQQWEMKQQQVDMLLQQWEMPQQQVEIILQQWENHNSKWICFYSNGIETTASGDTSTAMGDATTASGNASTAMGDETTASGYFSTAMGGGTEASGDYSTAMGRNTTASDYGSLVIGQYNSSGSSATSATSFSTANTAFVIGNGANAGSLSDAFKVMFNGDTYVSNSLYLGGTKITSTATELNLLTGATSLGTGILSPVTENSNTGVRLSTALAANHGDIGSNAVDLSYSPSASTTRGATGNISTAMGFKTTASGDYSTAMGGCTTASGIILQQWEETQQQVEMLLQQWEMAQQQVELFYSNGIYTTASGSVSTAMGDSTTASGDSSTAMGCVTTASDYGSLVIGQYNSSGSSATSANSFSTANTAFVIGNGADGNDISDAFSILFDGTTNIAGSVTATSFVGDGSGLTGITGTDGKSAYEIAVDNGFTGTIAEWLLSLNGTNGTDGTDGTDGTNGEDGANGTDGTDGTNGEDGTNGIDGTDGVDGTDGTNGTDGTDGTDGTNGIDGATGPQGEQGPQGEDGGDDQQLGNFILSADSLLSLSIQDGNGVSVNLAPLLADLEAENDELTSLVSTLQSQMQDLIIRMEIREECACDPTLGNGDNTLQPDKAYLLQNIPNPFNNTTSVGYFVPYTNAKAHIVISTMAGQIVHNMELSNLGVGAVSIDNSRMASAVYLYTLYVDGKRIDTKRMIVE